MLKVLYPEIQDFSYLAHEYENPGKKNYCFIEYVENNCQVLITWFSVLVTWCSVIVANDKITQDRGPSNEDPEPRTNQHSIPRRLPIFT